MTLSRLRMVGIDYKYVNTQYLPIFERLAHSKSRESLHI